MNGARRWIATGANKRPDEQSPAQKNEPHDDLVDGGVDGSDGNGDNSGDIAKRLGKLSADLAVNPLTYLAAIALAVQLVQLLGERDLTIFVLAAAPIVGLTALSRSPLGSQVQADLNAKLPELEADAEAMKARWADAKARSPYYGATRPRWPASLGGGAPHLTGQLPGDYGFDPLGLLADEPRRRWIEEAELLHARWAMLAVVGCAVPEALSMGGVDLGEPVWWKVGAAKLRGDITLNYAGIEGFRIAGKQGIWLIAACQLVLMGGPEYARYVGIKSLQPVGVFLPGVQSYPGGVPFDPLKYSERPDEFLEQQVKEIKNGRLAMVAMLGYFVQAAVTRKGPLQNVADFVADPLHNSVLGLLPGL